MARPIGDPELRAVLPSIPAGVMATLLLVAASVPYLLSTSSGSDRTASLVLLGVAAAGTLPFLVLPFDRMLARRSVRSAFFLSWTAADVILISAIAILDGGVVSPFTVLLFLTQAFSAVFYPPRLVILAAAMNLTGLAAIAVIGGANELTATLFEGAALVGTSMLCAWAAINAATQRRELARISRTDPLTGCLNRLGLEERLENEVARAARTGASFAVVIVDLDEFKRVNDEHGHAAGDDLLCEIVAAMAEVTRGIDALGRLGGDEFALVFPDAKCAALPILLGRVERAVSPLAPCSLGGACYPDQGDSADEILVCADREMYRNKHLVPAANGHDPAALTLSGA
jgi:diguanylate cyclase (GGDEF)-like protein